MVLTIFTVSFEKDGVNRISTPNGTPNAISTPIAISTPDRERHLTPTGEYDKHVDPARYYKCRVKDEGYNWQSKME